MVLLQWLWPRGPNEPLDTAAVYYTLRIVMFILSFVLEDWAIHELVHSPRYRRQAVVLVASSYVTWTYQTHTFSNSIETLIVLWSLVLIERIAREEVRVCISASLLKTDPIAYRMLPLPQASFWLSCLSLVHSTESPFPLSS